MNASFFSLSMRMPMATPCRARTAAPGA